jgi:hypothetical protein
MHRGVSGLEKERRPSHYISFPFEQLIVTYCRSKLPHDVGTAGDSGTEVSCRGWGLFLGPGIRSGSRERIDVRWMLLAARVYSTAADRLSRLAELGIALRRVICGSPLLSNSSKNFTFLCSLYVLRSALAVGSPSSVSPSVCTAVCIGSDSIDEGIRERCVRDGRTLYLRNVWRRTLML